MSLVLGIDPGTRVTGYGLVSSADSRLAHVASGCIRTDAKAPLAARLAEIFNGVQEVISAHTPTAVAIERIFLAQSPETALKLGHARGAAMVAAVKEGLPVHEYEARKVKQALVGTGAADKAQVQHMVARLLRLPAPPAEDAADALAVAITHINTTHNLVRLPQGEAHYRRGRLVPTNSNPPRTTPPAEGECANAKRWRVGGQRTGTQGRPQ